MLAKNGMKNWSIKINPNPLFLKSEFFNNEEKIAFINDIEFAVAFSKLSEIALRHSKNSYIVSKTNP